MDRWSAPHQGASLGGLVRRSKNIDCTDDYVCVRTGATSILPMHGWPSIRCQAGKGESLTTRTHAHTQMIGCRTPGMAEQSRT